MDIYLVSNFNSYNSEQSIFLDLAYIIAAFVIPLLTNV